MVLNELLKKELERQLQQHTGKTHQIQKVLSVHGGDTHAAYHLLYDKNDFFLKLNKDIPHKDLFKKEYNGLMLLKESKTVAVASPLFYGEVAGYHYLMIEFLPKAAVNPSFWELFAQDIADMHRCSQSQFGLDEDNYIGPLPQPNDRHELWTNFYISQRLMPLIRKCMDKGLLDKSMMKHAEYLFAKLPEIFPEEKPALVHGDLWGGNYLPGPGGKPYVFDPAVYYGNREMDLAMTRLFGGFDRRFYWHYEEFFPLASGWQKRISLCQLYPLLVHSLLFGGGYVQRVRKILSEY